MPSSIGQKSSGIHWMGLSMSAIGFLSYGMDKRPEMEWNFLVGAQYRRILSGAPGSGVIFGLNISVVSSTLACGN